MRDTREHVARWEEEKKDRKGGVEGKRRVDKVVRHRCEAGAVGREEGQRTLR